MIHLRTMDEILQIGRDRHVDCVFLAGDLFHHNKPSRRTMFRAQQVFRKHVFGDGPVLIQVTSDQISNFGGRIANYEDPNLSVQLPIFIIHGNHDDPTREGATEQALSAIDILAETGLVNYFGRADKADDIKIRPVLIEKGPVKVALYGLGWVRDERLYRTFRDKKVTFVKVEGEEGDSKNWFNVMLIHQNRAQKGRGEKNCVAESMIPDFMDLVFWGHEHECEITPIEKGSFFLSQPGSSIACSLVEGEAIPKHVGILEVKFGKNEPSYRLTPIPLKTVRPFLLDSSIELAREESLQGDMPETDKQVAVMTFLTQKVNEMLEKYQKEDSTTSASGKKRIPIVRLKVEHTGFPTINFQRFGAQFTSKVANPGEILHFWRKKKMFTKRNNSGGEDAVDDLNNEMDDVVDDVDFDSNNFESAQDRIHKMTEQILRESAQKLELLTEKKLHEAVEEFVVKETSGAISDFLEDALKQIQTGLRKERNQLAATENGAGLKLNNENAITEAINNVVAREKKKDEVERTKQDLRREREDILKQSQIRIQSKKIQTDSESGDDNSNEEDEEEDSSTLKKKKLQQKTKKISPPPQKKVVTSEEEEEIISIEEEDEEDEEEEKKSTTKRNKIPPSKRPAAVAKKLPTTKTTSTNKVASTTSTKQQPVSKKRKHDSDEEEPSAITSSLHEPKYGSSSTTTTTKGRSVKKIR